MALYRRILSRVNDNYRLQYDIHYSYQDTES